MSLRLKFNLILVLTSFLGILAAGLVLYDLLQRNAREEVMQTAAVMMESAMAVRSYTVKELRPLLNEVPRNEFLPQTVPAYAASRYVENLQQSHPDFSYKEAALNPTNPAHRATEWEADIIEWFRNHQNEQELVGDRDTPTGPTLFVSRPIRITNESCLTCHDVPARAPQTMLDRYGLSNGFGWKLDEVIGAQVVTVPQSLPLQRAQRVFVTAMAALVVIFLVVGAVLNVLLHRFVLRPVGMMAKHANEVSMGTLDVPELELPGKDEIASLSRSFNRMQRSLTNAVDMLNETMDESGGYTRSR